MVPIRNGVCRGCGHSFTADELSASRCPDCFEKIEPPIPPARVKIRACSLCRSRKPLADMMLFADGWICVDCYQRGVTEQKRMVESRGSGLSNECPNCNVIKASSEMATDRDCCLECAVELDRGIGLTPCPECGKPVAMPRDGAALCTVCANLPIEIDWGDAKMPDDPLNLGTKVPLDGAPGSVQEGRVCLICRLPRLPEKFPGQGTICKSCASSLPRELVERMQRCRGCNLEKPSSELLGTMYCAACRQLQELQMAIEVMTGIPESGAGAYTPADKGPPAPEIGRIPRAIATEEE